MKGSCILIFGESSNDAEAVGHLVKALRPDAPNVRPRNSPIILSRDAAEAKRRKNRNLLAAVVRAERVRTKVVAVIVHRDCDAVEPAHRRQSAILKRDFKVDDVDIIAATPAFEIEAWWFLWPDAVAAVNAKWTRLKCLSRNHGMIVNTKERLTHELRPSKGRLTNEYSEADSPRVAEMVRELGIVHQRCGRSDSFEDFVHEIETL